MTDMSATWVEYRTATPQLVAELGAEIHRLKEVAEGWKIAYENQRGVNDEIVRLSRLTKKEVRTLKWAADWVERSTFKRQAAVLRELAERLK